MSEQKSQYEANAPRYTVAFEFTPSMLVSVAAKDISRRVQNEGIAKHNRECGTRVLDRKPFVRYAYHHRDVRRAKSPAHLLALAVGRAHSRFPHKQKNRKLLYGNPELLERALALALEREATK